MKSVLPELRNALDGKNLDVVLTEFGTRFHKLLLDHLYQYTFTDVGKFAFSNVDCPFVNERKSKLFTWFTRLKKYIEKIIIIAIL